MMKKFLIVAGLVASTVSYGMFKNVPEASGSGRVVGRPAGAIEAIKIKSDPTGRSISFLHTLTLPGLKLAQVEVILGENDKETTDQVTSAADGVAEWAREHKKFYDAQLGKDGALDGQKALKFAKQAADAVESEAIYSFGTYKSYLGEIDIPRSSEKELIVFAQGLDALGNKLENIDLGLD